MGFRQAAQTLAFSPGLLAAAGAPSVGRSGPSVRLRRLLLAPGCCCWLATRCLLLLQPASSSASSQASASAPAASASPTARWPASSSTRSSRPSCCCCSSSSWLLSGRSRSLALSSATRAMPAARPSSSSKHPPLLLLFRSNTWRRLAENSRPAQTALKVGWLRPLARQANSPLRRGSTPSSMRERRPKEWRQFGWQATRSLPLVALLPVAPLSVLPFQLSPRDERRPSAGPPARQCERSRKDRADRETLRRRRRNSIPFSAAGPIRAAPLEWERYCLLSRSALESGEQAAGSAKRGRGGETKHKITQSEPISAAAGAAGRTTLAASGQFHSLRSRPFCGATLAAGSDVRARAHSPGRMRAPPAAGQKEEQIGNKAKPITLAKSWLDCSRRAATRAELRVKNTRPEAPIQIN